MSAQATIHSCDFSDHGEAYDFAMTHGRPGDFLELDNGDVVEIVEAWPVLIRGNNDAEILHRFEDPAMLQAALQRYEQAKAYRDENQPLAPR